MKALLVSLLLLSLAANAVLWLKQAGSSGHVAPMAVDSSRSEAVSSVSRTAETLPSSLHHDALPTDDLSSLVTHLRKEGMPERMIRALVEARLRREYLPRFEKLLAQAPDSYWIAYQRVPDEAEAGRRAAIRALDAELRQRLSTLVENSEEGMDPYQVAAWRKRHGPLDVETIQAIQAIEMDYFEMRRVLRESAQGINLPEDRETSRFLSEELKRDLLRLLTPEQYEARELRTSGTAHNMRRMLVVMEPSEEEFLTIYSLRRAHDDEFLGGQETDRSAPDFYQRQRESETKMIAAVKAALGPERGEEFERSRDHGYVAAHGFAKENNLSRDTGDRILELHRESTRQSTAIRGNGSLSPAEKAEKLRALGAASKASLADAIGEDGVQQYLQLSGDWLASIEQSAAQLSRTQPAR